MKLPEAPQARSPFWWFWERFTWRTVSYDVNGSARPQDAATYTSSLT